MVKIDCSLNKQFRVTERVGLELRTEAFNLFNHPNFSIPSQRAVFSGVIAATGLGIPVGKRRSHYHHADLFSSVAIGTESDLLKIEMARLRPMPAVLAYLGRVHPGGIVDKPASSADVNVLPCWTLVWCGLNSLRSTPLLSPYT